MDRDNLYSRFVAWSKILLPLVALALLSTLFLFARRPGESDIPITEIEEIARQPRISDPSYAGVAENGSIVVIAAETIRPLADRPDTYEIDEPRGRLDAADGSVVGVAAGRGEIDGRAQLVRLTGLARITTSTGYEMETGGLEVDLAGGEIRSLGPLEVRAPYGALTAGALFIATDPDEGGQRMLFTDGVRLLYDPVP